MTFARRVSFLVPAVLVLVLAAARPSPAAEKVKIEDGAGTLLWEVRPKDDGAKVTDARGREILRLKDKGPKTKLKGGDDAVLGVLTGRDEKLKLENATQTAVLFVIRRRDDGGYKLEDGAERTIAKVKPKPYGFKIEAAGKTTKVKTKDGKVVLRDASDRTLYATRSPIRPIALTALALEALSTEQRLALFHRLNRGAP